MAISNKSGSRENKILSNFNYFDTALLSNSVNFPKLARHRFDAGIPMGNKK
jgi:hypothetical protein